jgi:drug/metabolite transporter (DMT)-like permease
MKLRYPVLNPYFEMLLGATIGATSGVFIKLLQLPSTTMGFFRFAIPTLVILGYFRWNGLRILPGNRRLMLTLSLLNAARMFFFFVAYLYTTMGNAIIILFTWPIFAAIFGMGVLKEKADRRSVWLILLAFAGIVIMYSGESLSFGNRDFLGMLYMLISAIIYGIVTVLFKREAPNYSKIEAVFYQNVAGAIVFLPFFVLKPLPEPAKLVTATIYALIVGLLGWIIFMSALKRLRIGHYALLSYFEVPAAIIFGVLFFGETVTRNMVAGGALILIASLLLQTRVVAGAAVETD